MKTVQPGNLKAAFSRLDLLFASATAAILLLLAASATATTATQAEATTCTSNNQTLIDAWAHYAADNNGLMTGPVHGGLAQNPAPAEGPASIGAHPWAVGWLDWTTATSNTNHTYMTDPRYGSLALYVNRRPEIFRCPSDRFASAAQTARGWSGRARSYTASNGLGDGNGGPGDGPWDPKYIKARNLSQLIKPPPTSVYVFIEEHPDSMNDPAFMNPYFTSQTSWLDLPGNLHSGAATLAYADGRVEQKLWQGGVRTLAVKYFFTDVPPSPANQNDIRYLAARAPQVP